VIAVESQTSLERFLKARGIDLDRSPLLDICRACLAFYADVRAVGIVPIEEDGDMFLFQWGRSEYDKRPDQFYVDLVRQFIMPEPAEEGEEEEPEYSGEDFFQLHCTIWMPPTPFTAIANGHLWLTRPAGVPQFQADLERHPVLVAARGQQQTASEIALEKV
jgi:hypothetical protein